MASLTTSSASAVSGRTDRIGRYRIIGELGRGGMGVVYRAEDERLGRSVALKLLPAHLGADPVARRRLTVEARAAAALDHPNVCTVYEVGETDDGQPYIAFACYDGQTLRDRLRAGPLPVPEAVRIAREVASGVAAAHACGIVHRDLKPSNVFLCEDGTAKVLDFGIAKIQDTFLTPDGETPGTVEYGAPETAQGRGDERSDVWSLGVMLFEMLTGRRPFGGSYQAAVLYAILHETPPAPSAITPAVPEAVDAVVARSLAKAPEDRYPDAASVVAVLAPPEAERAEDVGVTLRRAGRVAMRRFRRSRLGQAAAAAVVLCGLGVGVWTVASGGGDEEPALPDAIHLAVLPPTPRPDTPYDRAAAEGLAETLASGITELGEGSEGFWVAPVSEMLDLGVSNAREAGDRLGVNVALTGGLQRQGGQTTLTLNLVTATGQPRSISARTITIPTAEEASIRGRALVAIAEMLGLAAPAADDARLASGTADPEAWRFYLAGVSLLERNQEAGDVAQAVGLFEQAIAEDSAFAKAHARLGEALLVTYEKTRDSVYVGRAEAAAAEAQRLDPDDASVHVTLSKLHLTTGQARLAMRHARQALDLDPGSLTGTLALAAAQEASADVDGAEATLRDLVRRAPDSWLGPLNLGKFLFRQQQYPEAAAQFERVTALAPGNFQGHLALGGTRQMLGDDEAAVSAFEAVVRLRPDHPAAYNNLGTILLNAGYAEQEAGRTEAATRSFHQAVRRYREAVERDSVRVSVWRNLASAYSALGDEPRRLDALRGALRRAEADLAVNPDDAKILAGVATYRSELGDREGALEAARRAADLAPTDPGVQIEAASVFAASGDTEAAVGLLADLGQAGYALDGMIDYDDLEPLADHPRIAPFVTANTD